MNSGLRPSKVQLFNPFGVGCWTFGVGRFLARPTLASHSSTLTSLVRHGVARRRLASHPRLIRCSVFGVRCLPRRSFAKAGSMFSFFALCSFPFAVLLLPLSFASAQVDEAPYFGDWENDRGDTLQITSDNIKVNNEKQVRYDDITEDSDETFFVLQIKGSSESSYFGGNFLRITFGKDPDHFTMSIYKTLPDTLKQENEVKRIEWSAPAEENEEADQKDQPKEDQTKEEEKKNDQGEKATPYPSATSSPSAP